MALSQNVTPDSGQNHIQFPHNNKQFRDIKAQSFLDTNHKKSVSAYSGNNTFENLQQSKSTRVSPSRYSVAPNPPNSQHMNVLSYIENFNQQQNKIKSGSSNQNHSQFNLRLPVDKMLNSNLVSQTQTFHQRKKSQNQTSISGNSINCDEYTIIDSNQQQHNQMHHSFINSIYPSKSKKLITSENHVKDGHSHNHHHQKSKSLFIGDMQSAKQDQSIQKVQHASYKKQSQVFNYSKKLKQLLKDNSEDQIQSQQLFKYPLQAFSQQHSPSNQYKQKMNNQTLDNQPNQKAKVGHVSQLQSTFDKVGSHTTDYNQPQLHFQNQPEMPQHLSYTLDYFLGKSAVQQKSLTSANTPSNAAISMRAQNEQSVKSLHMRKPSQPVKNNFIIDFGTQNQAAKIEPKMGRDPSQEQRDRSNEMVKQQHREKKQHQPTQSKILQHNKADAKMVYHQRSQSDFNVEQFNQMRQLNRYANSNSNADFNHPDIMSQEDPFRNHTPKALEVDKPSSFLKQYSQVMIDTSGPFNSKTQSLVTKTENNKKLMKHSYIEQPQMFSKLDTKNIYHQRKLSFQPQTQPAISSRKSPQKQSFIYKDKPRKTSPKPIFPNSSSHLLQQKANQQSSKSIKSNNVISFSHKTSTITSPVGSVQPSSQIALQSSQKQTKHICQSKNCKCGKKDNHSASAATLMMHHQRSKSDINNTLFQQVKQNMHERQSSIPSHTNIKQTQNRMSTINSEKVSPRKQSSKPSQEQPTHRSKVANISIDLYRPMVQESQALSFHQQQSMQRTSSKPTMSNSNSMVGNQQIFLKRKDSFVVQTQKDISPTHHYNQQMKSSPSKTLFHKSKQSANQLKQNTKNIFSPSERSNSYGNLNNTNKPNVSKRYQVVDMSDESMINMSNISCELGGQFSESQTKKKHPKISETEHLLQQIRNKDVKVQRLNLQDMSFENDNALNLKQRDLYKITEHNLEQNLHIDTLIHNSQRPAQLNFNTHDSSSLYLTTDPNLSPLSKDQLKLKKLIKFNFNKYNDAPVTTSEFYRIGRVLGRGAFGKVNLAAHKLSEQLVAIKSISKEFLKSEEDQKNKIMKEVAILKQSNHPSVVRLFDSFETNKHICFVMELCSGGDLLTYVRKRRKLKEDVAKYFFKQIIEGLAYIHHSKLIVHRDIKLDNILLDANGKIKICDFGVSKQVSCETEKMTEQCGTPAYIAPEILRDKGYEGFKVDVWSAGVCLYAMLVGTVPFKAASMHELHNLIITGKYDISEEKLSEPAKDLIAKLLTVDPKKRLSAYEVLGHPWLKDALNEMDIFTQKEKDSIFKEYISKNIDKQNRNVQSVIQDTDVVFTEHNLDTKTHNNSFLKNASTKSLILAPFNSTISDVGDSNNLTDWPTEVKELIINKKVIKFAAKCRDLNRQYENNNNADLDNGVYNNIDQDKEEEAKDGDEERKSETSSVDSIQKSFKETELSSDDERAGQQIEEARERKLKQQSELQEFEQQLKQKYVKYKEPAHSIDSSIVHSIVQESVYPKEYLIKVLTEKEMNYATAHYNLLLKKRSLESTILNRQQ